MFNAVAVQSVQAVITMSHLQIAELLQHDRPDNVKRTIERLAESGTITFTPTEEKGLKK